MKYFALSNSTFFCLILLAFSYFPLFKRQTRLVQESEHRYQQESSFQQQELYDLKRQLEEEARSHRDVEAELVRFQEEVRRDKEDATRARAATQSRLKDKDAEIERLRNSVSFLSNNIRFSQT